MCDSVRLLLHTKFLWAFVLLICPFISALGQSKAGEATVKEGNTTTISLATTYQNSLRQSKNISFLWSTSNSNAVITSQTMYSAIVKGVTAGTVKVYYKCSYTIDGFYRTMNFYYDVTVNASGPTGIRISPTELSLVVGESDMVSATQTGVAGGTYFTSSDNDVVSVSYDSSVGFTTYGYVTAKSAGTAYVYAKTSNGLSAGCKVTVVPKVKPNYITLPGSINVYVGETVQVTPTVLPSNANYTVTWSLQADDIATVSKTGLVTGVGEGLAVLTASIDGTDLVAACIVFVKPKPVDVTSFRVGEPPIMAVGDECKLEVVVEPEDATADFQYSSSDTTVVQVSSAGVIHAVGIGEAVVSVIDQRTGKEQNVSVIVDRLRGDVNGDNCVTIADVTRLVNCILEWNLETDEQRIYDINSDGIITIADVTSLVNIILGK